ncbi:hypothetical protein VMCG_03225 [Cytospora schulzeri]|uniref:N-acetyltransferase domain-containing protein n=1 Tax=Cytospora schulzeri TaxID=448051 RepID=A0A423WXT5_9PEZI|nr:hypothetical protein VMCG_03225 [Valsa malicola]
MRNSNTISSILLSLLLSPSPTTTAAPHQAPLGPFPSPSPSPAKIPFTFRNATPEDMDDMATVWYDAFRPAPMWKYIRQFTDDVDPLYAWTCQRDAFRRMLDQDEEQDLRATVITVQVPDPSISSSSSSSSLSWEGATATRERVVSLAMWDFNETRQRHDGEGSSSSMLSPMSFPLGLHDSRSSSGISSSSPFNCSAHLDMNMTRVRHLMERAEGAHDKYLRKPLGPQLYLSLLATHPDWDGNGFGATQLRWGKAQLERLGGEVYGGGSLPLTLMATPAGYPLYVSEGLEGVRNVTVERLDGQGWLWTVLMKFEEGVGGADEL